MEQCNNITRSETWNNIYEILARLDLRETTGDCMDRPSAATEIEELFLKLLPIQNVSERFLDYEEWYTKFKDEINIEFTETGADRMEKEYIFKCKWAKGEHPCNGEHKFILDDSLKPILIYKLVFNCGITITKKIFEGYWVKFEKFVNDTYERNKTDLDMFSHYNSIDIDAELIVGFIEKISFPERFKW